MRNVHHLPTETRLLRWMEEADFAHAEIIDVTAATIEEQRATDRMPSIRWRMLWTSQGNARLKAIRGR